VKNLFLLTAFALLWAGVSTAQETASNALPVETAARFDMALMEIAAKKDDVASLTQRAGSSEGLMAELLLQRRDSLWIDIFRDTMALAKDVAAEVEAGRDADVPRAALIPELEALPEELQGMLERVAARVEVPPDDIAIHERVMLDQEFFQELDNLQYLLEAMADFVDISEVYGIDSTSEQEFVNSTVTENAANIAAYLALAQKDVTTLTATAATLPDNTDIADSLSAATERTRLAAAAMQNVVTLMDELGLDTRNYREQLLTTTGEITADVLDVGLVAGLVADWGQAGAEIVRKHGLQLIFQILFVALILFVFWQLGKLAERVVKSGLGSRRVRMSHLLKKMLSSTARNIVFGIGILIGLSQFGISLGPVLAGLGIAGFIIGFALQDTLSNFASGLMILIYRPFDVGDLVEAGGVSGKVSHMSLVNTTFMTLDNQRLIVPNNMIWQDVIKNVTSQRVRRIDLVFGVSYSDDLDKVESVLAEIVDGHEAILDSPEPMIKMHELADSSVNFIVRPWVKTDDYWDTYWDLMKTVKQRFDAEGISIPFPQRDVHMIEPSTT
jgi:small conductance mechanosensitive channel